MRYTLIIAFLYLALGTTLGQKKQLSLEDAIINRYRTLSPEYTSQLQWLPSGEAYSYSKDNTLYVKKIGKQKSTTLSLQALNSILDDSLKYMPRISWNDDASFTVNTKEKKHMVDLASSKITKSSLLPKDGENMDYSAEANAYAYTKDNNLYLWKNDKEINISHDDNTDHVYGQAVSRYEFGISKGTFWSPDGKNLLSTSRTRKM